MCCDVIKNNPPGSSSLSSHKPHPSGVLMGMVENRESAGVWKVPLRTESVAFHHLGMRHEQWDREHAGRHRISLFLCGLLKKLCSKERAEPFESPPGWQSSKGTRRSRSSSATKSGSRKLDARQTLSIAAGDPLILKLGPFSLTSWKTPAPGAIQYSTDCISWLKKPLMG